MVHMLVLTELILLRGPLLVFPSMPSLTPGAKKKESNLSRYNELKAPEMTNAYSLLSHCATGSET